MAVAMAAEISSASAGRGARWISSSEAFSAVIVEVAKSTRILGPARLSLAAAEEIISLSKSPTFASACWNPAGDWMRTMRIWWDPAAEATA